MMLSFVSCKDNKENSQDQRNTDQEEYVGTNDDENTESYNEERPEDLNEIPDSGKIQDSVKVNDSRGKLSGTYIKSDHPEDHNCNCYCIDVSMAGTSELCLSEGKLYINGRFEQSGNTINIYYTGKSSRTSDTEIPWDEFEKNTPIATLNPSGDGFKLDWKGFMINGEIAVDYALYGKKTLEGTYEKK